MSWIRKRMKKDQVTKVKKRGFADQSSILEVEIEETFGMLSGYFNKPGKELEKRVKVSRNLDLGPE